MGSDYINKLLEASRIIEFEGMTLDELIIHIFIRDADATMGKAAQDALMEKEPNVYNVVNMIKQYESQSWYNPRKKEYGRMASSRNQKERYCRGCDSNTHDESACWGVCPHCNMRGHQAIYCRKKGNDQANQQPGRAEKASQKNKKKKKKTGKRVATVTDSNSRRESEEEESEYSEDESPKKEDNRAERSRSVRLARNQPISAVRSLNDQLSNLDEEERVKMRTTRMAKRVYIARED